MAKDLTWSHLRDNPIRFIYINSTLEKTRELYEGKISAALFRL